MEAIFKFDLNDPDEKMKFKRMLKADDMAFFLHHLLYNMKKELNWEIENKELDKYDAVEIVFRKIYELRDQYGVDVDDILE